MTIVEQPPMCRECPVLSTSLYADCEPAELAQAERCREYHVYEAGEAIFTQGEAIRGICCLYSGRVSLVQTKGDGTTITLYVAEGGETIGLPDLMEENCHTRSAIALERTELCFTPMTSFRQLFATVGPIAIRTIRSICQRINDAERRAGPTARAMAHR